MNSCFSDVYNNASAFQAWRAGFREGVKMSLERGVRLENRTFRTSIHWKNMQRLLVWLNIGKDSDNGDWAILGARQGCYMTNCTDWDYIQVRDFDYLTEFWNNEVKDITAEELSVKIIHYGNELKKRLDLEICELDVDASKFFKGVFKNSNRSNHGFLEKE